MDKQNRVRTNILTAATRLLQKVGRDALTIRRVADEADVQLPTIYRLFKDKASLLDAVAEDGFKKYMEKNPEPIELDNPIEEFRNGWNMHIKFGLQNPELYKLMYGNAYSGKLTPAAQFAFDGLDSLMSKIAATGCLKVSQEAATFAAFASASGAVIAMLSIPRYLNDTSYSENIREYVIQSIMDTQAISDSTSTVSRSATALKANLKDITQLSQSEKNLLSEWLKRIS